MGDAKGDTRGDAVSLGVFPLLPSHASAPDHMRAPLLDQAKPDLREFFCIF
jgi:hypothetical protein